MFSLRKGIWILMAVMITASVVPASADLRTVHKFKKVAIPFDMTHDEKKIEKGTFDFEIMVERSLRIWTLRISRRGKTLCALPGEILRDRPPVETEDTSPGVPEKPTFRIKKIPDENLAYFIFENPGLESGTVLFPYYIVRFKVGLAQE